MPSRPYINIPDPEPALGVSDLPPGPVIDRAVIANRH
jgi:hypothetical protein